MAKSKAKAKTSDASRENYIYTDNATFRGDILETNRGEMSERRRKRLEKGAKVKKQKTTAKRRKSVRILTRLLLMITICFVVAFLGKSVKNLITLEAEKKEKQAELEALQNEISKDQDILEQVNSDEYVEQQARSELKMIKEGEVLYIVRDDGTKVEVDENGNPVDAQPGN